MTAVADSVPEAHALFDAHARRAGEGGGRTLVAAGDG